MFKRFLTPILLILFLLIIPPFFYLFNFSQSASPNMENKTEYELPYPGLLPDHPLYLLKTLRDRTLVFITRDYETKARLQLELSDKRVRAGELLVSEKKHDLAIPSFSKGEKYFEQSIETLSSAKKQGQAPTSAFIDQMIRSNKKHREILVRSGNSMPQSLRFEMGLVLQRNEKNEVDLQSLK